MNPQDHDEIQKRLSDLANDLAKEISERMFRALPHAEGVTMQLNIQVLRSGEAAIEIKAGEMRGVHRPGCTDKHEGFDSFAKPKPVCKDEKPCAKAEAREAAAKAPKKSDALNDALNKLAAEVDEKTKKKE